MKTTIAGAMKMLNFLARTIVKSVCKKMPNRTVHYFILLYRYQWFTKCSTQGRNYIEAELAIFFNRPDDQLNIEISLIIFHHIQYINNVIIDRFLFTASFKCMRVRFSVQVRSMKPARAYYTFDIYIFFF